jgi:16S rRNA processing protein RimM
MSVVNEVGETLGTVLELLDTGANDVLIVKGTGPDVLIPFLDSVIKQVDLQAKIIRVDWAADFLL